MDNQKQHFVPKVYLKEFSRLGKGHFYTAGPKPNFLKSIGNKHVSQVCYVDNFYTLRQETKDHFELKDILFLENKAFEYEKRLLPKIFEKLKHKNAYLNRSHFDKLIEIYLSIKQRNSFYRNNFRNADLSAITDKQIKGFLPLKLLIEKMSGQDFDTFMARVKGQILEDKDLPDELHKQTIIETAHGTNEAINDASKILKKMALHVLEPLNNSDYFITSDNPGFSLLENKVFNTNFGRFDSVGFPINSKQAIFLSGISNESNFEIHKRINFVKIGSKDMDLINYSTIFNANEYVFCESKKFLSELVERFLNDQGHK